MPGWRAPTATAPRTERTDRDAADRYRFTVEFSSHERGRENSNRPETAEFAAFLAAIAHGSLIFCNLDVLREADL